MIHVTILHNLDNNIIGLDVKGHAGFEEEGKDIVCAAVSSLVQSVYLCLNDYLKLSVDCLSNKGDFKLVLKDETNEVTQSTFMVAILGCLAIAKQYPKYVEVNDNRRCNNV